MEEDQSNLDWCSTFGLAVQGHLHIPSILGSSRGHIMNACVTHATPAVS